MKLSLDEELLLLKDYKSGIYNKDLCKKYGVSKDIPTKIAKKYGVQKGSGLKSVIDPDIFNPNNEEGSYWLGYIIADGSVQKSIRAAIVSLASIDQEIINKYKKFLNTKVGEYTFKKTGVKIVYFGSKKVVDRLLSFGITPNKSLTIDLKIPLNNHIIRGIFDGDGWVRSNKKHSYESKITSGSIKLIEKISEFLSKHDIFYIIKKKENAFDINFYRKEDSRKFYNLIYKDATIFLERKRKKFDDLFKS